MRNGVISVYIHVLDSDGVWALDRIDTPAIYWRSGVNEQWNVIEGSLTQADCGPMGFFAVNHLGNVYYRTETKDGSSGVTWQL